jgi:hypothetical protein
MNKEDMATRMEVQDIIDRTEKEIHRDFSGHFNTLREEIKNIKVDLDRDMHSIAREEVQHAKEGITKFIGWGGILTIGSAFWFFSVLQADVRYLQAETEKTNAKLEAVEKFMNSGDRFTAEDGNELKGYVDQQDEYILQKVEDGFEAISKQIEKLSN